MGRLRPAPKCTARANLAAVGVTTARTAQIDVVARVDTALRVFCSTAATGLHPAGVVISLPFVVLEGPTRWGSAVLSSASSEHSCQHWACVRHVQYI